MVSTSFSQVRREAVAPGRAKVIMFGELIFARWRGSGLRHWAVARSVVVLSWAGFGLCGGLIDLAQSTVKISRIAWYA